MKMKKKREEVRGEGSGRRMCKKNGSYCEKEKKVCVCGGEGGGGHGRCE